MNDLTKIQIQVFILTYEEVIESFYVTEKREYLNKI